MLSGTKISSLVKSMVIRSFEAERQNKSNRAMLKNVHPIKHYDTVITFWSSAGMPNALHRSNVLVSNFRPNSRARRQELFSSARDGRRAISAYLFRYLALAGSQKLSGWNCAITFTGVAGTCSAIHSSTGYVQHWT